MIVIWFLLAIAFCSSYFLKTGNYWTTGGLALGWTLGLVGMWLDRHWGWRKYAPLINGSDQNARDSGETGKIISRSLLFLAMFWPLTIFLLSSSTSPIGSGLLLGIGWTVVGELWQKHRDLAGFKTFFGLPPHSKLTTTELKIGTYIWGILISISSLVVWL